MKTPVQSGARIQAPDIIKLKSYLVNAISHEMVAPPASIETRRAIIQESLKTTYAKTKLTLPEDVRAQIFRDVEDELLGYGPIQPLLDDPEITEVMVNGAKRIFVERKGKLIKTNVAFESDDHVLRIIERIILPFGRRLDPDSPTVDARLPDGSRVNAVIAPVAIDGPSITIRKFSRDKLTIPQLIELQSITPGLAEFLQACVVSRLNIVVSGGTGSGRTTLLNILSSYIPEDERIVTIEDALELQLRQEHIVRMETKPSNVEGRGLVTMRDLVKNSLRMRPDRLVVGEVRGGEVLDFLQAMNTGYDGSMTTLHANSPRDTLTRLETMALMSGVDLPLRVIREQITSGVDLIIQQSRMKDGSRRVTTVSEVAGMEGDTIVLTDVFRFVQTEITPDGRIIGELRPTGIQPLFCSRLEAAGFHLSSDIFGGKIAEALAGKRRRR